jgi:AraC-like DNA-binding protein
MTFESAGHVVVRTDSLPEGDRLSAFCQDICRHVGRVEVLARPPSPFHGELEVRGAGSVRIVKIASSPADYLRDANLVGDGNDHVLALLWREGLAETSQSGLETRLSPGDGVILDNAREWQGRVLESGKYWTLQIPRNRIKRLLPGVEAAAGSKLCGTSPATRLLHGYLDGTLDQQFDDGRAARLFGEHLIDLLALALDARGGGRRSAERGGARAAYLARVLHEIESRSAEPGLSAAAIAAQLEVTPRYVHLLLEETGRSFSQHVLERRLERAAARLRDPLWRERKIAEIALDVGFADLSHFNRVFRRRFGDTPSALRASAPQPTAEQ